MSAKEKVVGPVAVHVPALQALGRAMCERYNLGDQKDAPVVVFVLGAAASFRSRMPSWDHIRDELISKAESCFQGTKFVDEAWRQLAPYIGPAPTGTRHRRQALLDSATTEQILGVACMFEVVREVVVEVLAEHYHRGAGDVGEAPQLGYELIAHFVRHGFVDHVINFNFDEALDVALDNELGSQGYRRLLSDFDVTSSAPADPARGQVPHYLKLHGTISVPSSLRFTKDHTQTIPVAMLHTLDRLAFPTGGRRLHLVTLGYSWNDPDFVNWVVARVEHIESVTIVRGNKDTVPALLEARCQGRLTTLSVKVLNTAELKVDPDLGTSIDDVLWALANGIEKALAKKETAFVPIARHVVLGHLFGPDKTRPVVHHPVPWNFKTINDHNAEKRLHLELWLHLFKCQGMMTISSMAKTPRIQRYVEVLGTTSAWLARLQPIGTQPGSPLVVRETLFHRCTDENDAFKFLEGQGFLTFGQGQVTIPTLDLDKGTVSLRTKTSALFLQGLFNEIWLSDEVEVTTIREPRAEWLFGGAKPLTSYLALRQTTAQLLAKKWTHLLVIAESGEWLARQAKSLNVSGLERSILLIRVGDDGFKVDKQDVWGAWSQIKQGNQEKFDEGPKVHQATLPWWRHNRHLTLALDLSNKGSVHFQGGIYFRRRLKTSRISPVWLDNAGDCRELFLIFLAYTARAKKWEEQRVPEDFLKILGKIAAGLSRDMIDPRLTALIAALTPPAGRPSS